MPDFSKSKVYKIVCNVTGLVYIGSTSQKLSQRLQDHRLNYKKYLNGNTNYVSSFKIIENENYDIILIEDVPCERKEQLHARERYWIENTECVNIHIPTRTPKEYRKDNKEKLSEQKKEYYQKNKEQINEQIREYREENKDKIRERIKEHYQKNKKQIREQIKEYREENKDKIRERRKEHYQKNKEQISEQRKEYREKNKEQIRKREKEYYDKNKEHKKEYAMKNKEKISERKKEYYKKKKILNDTTINP